VNRVLYLLTGGAFLTLVLEVTDVDRPLPYGPRVPLLLGLVYALLATAGFAWVRRAGWPRGRVRVAGYVVVQLTLGISLFATGSAGVGSTLLLLILVSQSVLLLPLPGAALVIAVVPLAHLGMAWRDGVREGLGTLVAAVFAAVLTELAVRERRARTELAGANARLVGYAAQAEQLATIQERNRLARDIHDGLGHHLTVVQMQLQAARAVLGTGGDAGRERADGMLAKAQRQAEEALAEVRRSVAALREPRASRPLREVLAALAAETSAAVPTELEVAGAARSLPVEAEDALYRAAQEGLTNVRKHAEATHARLLLDYRHSEAVRLEVHDDGTGMAQDRDLHGPPGFGLLGLQERASRLGGRLLVDTAPGRGVTLRMEVPG